MPELAEVEFFRRRWDVGIGRRILEVRMNRGKRIFCGNNLDDLQRLLPGEKLIGSRARGKQMLFRFSNGACLGIHLGMSGKLRHEPVGFVPSKHDHLILRQARHELVFSDPRLFGRVLFHHGFGMPEWWSRLPPDLTSVKFTLERMCAFLRRRARSPIKSVLLQQELFIGLGNWMADEILWRARIYPRRMGGSLTKAETRRLWTAIRVVCKGALKIVAKNHSDPPPSWLFRHRWEKGGRCPRDGAVLVHASVGGRTTAWCKNCQPEQVHDI